MPENPYQSPQATTTQRTYPHLRRDRARFQWRLSLALLLIPGLYNYVCFDLVELASSPLPSEIKIVYRTLNIAAIVIVSTVVWWFGLPILELVTKLIHQLVSSRTPLSEWHAALYQTLKYASVYAAAGAVLWLIWVNGFYVQGINFYLLSYPIGLLAHLLAAGLYLPLIFRWYTIGRNAKRYQSI